MLKLLYFRIVKMRSYRLNFFILLPFLLIQNVYGQSDTVSPKLIDFAFTPKEINIAEGSSTVTATIRAWDDLKGVNSVLVGFISPDGQNKVQEFLPRISGDELEGTYEGNLAFDQYADTGVWKVELIQLRENAGDIVNIKTDELYNNDYPTNLHVISNVKDTASPELIDFGFSPKELNIAEGNSIVTATVKASDDLRGVNSVLVGFESPDGQTKVQEFLPRISGDELEGTYEGNLAFDQYADTGVWKVELIQLRENAGDIVNIKTDELYNNDYPTNLHVISNVKDTASPELIDFGFSPKELNIAEGNSIVTATVKASDDLRGVNSVLVGFESPDGQTKVQELLPRISGDELEGTYEGNLVFDQYADTGVWKVELVQLKENAGDTVNINSEELINLGYLTELHIYDYPTVYSNNYLNVNDNLKIINDEINKDIVIEFEIKRFTNVKVSIYNSSGRCISSLTNKYFEAGYHKVHIKGAAFPLGIYFCRLQFNDFSIIKKFLMF